MLSGLLLFFSIQLNAQCGYSGYVETASTGLYTPGCGSSTIAVGTNSSIRMAVTNGVWYDFNTCGSTYDTQLSGYNTGGTIQATELLEGSCGTLTSIDCYTTNYLTFAANSCM